MKNEKSESLLEKTLTLLRDSKQSPMAIHDETGINYFWLVRFMGGKIKNPSVSRVQELYEYLSGKRLQLAE